MKIYPAIDLMDGEAVRLKEGRKETKKDYGDPVVIAKRFAPHVDKIHVVDLDGAFSGNLQNLKVVENIRTKTGLGIQLGGGIRTTETLEAVKKIGVENPILGTKALEADFLKRAVEGFEGITVSLDLGPEGLAVEGWKRSVDLGPEEAFGKLKRYVDRFIFTSVSSDGRLEGISPPRNLPGNGGGEVIYAGGITKLEDLQALEERGFTGGIIGRALYEETLDLEEAVERFGDKDAG